MVDIENDIETLLESTCHFLVGKHLSMNGRCETNPLDQAINVCGTCYGDFCDACLVTLKGRKHPTCKECALIVSGVKGSAKPEIRGSRRTAKERREAYKSLPPEEKVFEYFDSTMGLEAGDEAEPTELTESTEEKKKSKRKKPSTKSKAAPEADDQPTADNEDQEESQRNSNRTIRKRKKKASDQEVDTSSELARLEHLSDDPDPADEPEPASDPKGDATKSKSRGKSRTGKKRNGRSHSAINKLEEIQSASPTPPPKRGRLVPPRKPTTEDTQDATVPDALAPKEEPMSETLDQGSDQSPQTPETTDSTSDSKQTTTSKLGSDDLAKTTTNDTDQPNPVADRDSADNSPAEPSSQARKARKTWPKTSAQSTPKATKRPASRARWPGTDKQKPSIAKSDEKPSTDAPISGPAILDKLTKAKPTTSTESKADPAAISSSESKENSSSTGQASPAKDKESGLNVTKPDDSMQAQPQSELEPPSLTEDPFASTRNIHTEDFSTEPPPPSPTQARGSAENMPVVGSASTDDDSPTTEFKTFSPSVSEVENTTDSNPGIGELANTELKNTDTEATDADADATISKENRRDPSVETWDPNATPWSTSTDSWDGSVPVEDEPRPSFAPEPPFSDHRDDAVAPTDAEVVPTMSPVEALMFGTKPADSGGASTTSVLEPDTDLTSEFVLADSSEVDAAGNWIPPALRGVKADRRDDD